MEDRHDESQSPAPGSPATRASEAAVTSASASSSGALSEETLAYLRKRVEEAAQHEGAGDAAEQPRANDGEERKPARTGDEAHPSEDAQPPGEATFVLEPSTLVSLGQWQRLEARVRSSVAGNDRDNGNDNGNGDRATGADEGNEASSVRKPVVLECSALRNVDSLALGRLVILHDLVWEKGYALALLAVPEAVRRSLATMGLHELLPCYANGEALANGTPLPPVAANEGDAESTAPSASAAAAETERDGTNGQATGGPPATPHAQTDATQAAGDKATNNERGATTEGPNSEAAAAVTEQSEQNEHAATSKHAKPQRSQPKTEEKEFPVQSVVEAVRTDLRTMYDALVGEMRNRFREVEQNRTNLQNLGKALNQVQGFLGEVATRLTAFEQHLNRLTGYFNERFRADKQSQSAFDRLHEELKFYRDDALFRSQKPVYMDLILLYDDVGRMLRDERDEDAANKFALLREVILEILYRRDVEVIEERPTQFDKKFQKALKRIPTEDQSLDRTVAEVVRDGFRWGESILRPQEVVVRRYDGADGDSESEYGPAEARASDTGHPEPNASSAEPSSQEAGKPQAADEGNAPETQPAADVDNAPAPSEESEESKQEAPAESELQGKDSTPEQSEPSESPAKQSGDNDNDNANGEAADENE